MTSAPLGTSEHPLRVAVIGAGPSGFYAAEHLQERDGLVVQVDMYDRLPTPFGLVRGGVAPDHQKIKSVTRVYDRIATHPEFRFYGNVELGRDLTHADLIAYYHAMIYAVGARTDRRMGIPREHLPGSHSATEFVGWYNAHPDHRSLSFDLSGEVAVVIGNGNVAMDLARILASPPEALAGTDIAEHALEALAASRIREIHVLGRRGPAQASFTTKELRELGEIPGVDVVIDPAALELDPLTKEDVTARPDRTRERNLQVLGELAARPAGGAGKRIVLHFLTSPIEIVGTERVRALRIARTELWRVEDGALRARAVGEPTELATGLVFRAIGYQGVPLPGVPFDEQAGVIPNEAGRIRAPGGAARPGEYVVGWIKRGPRGIIGTNKPDALETVEALLADLATGALAKEEVPPREVLERLLAERRQDLVSYEDWQLIDLLEQERGRERGERPRLKFSRVEEMLAALAEHKQAHAEGARGERG